MKFFIIVMSAAIAFSTASFAYIGRRTEYYCKGKGAQIAIVSDTEKSGLNVVGKLGGKSIDFWSSVVSHQDLMILKNTSGITVKIQRAGPYDGGQDSLWGGIAADSSKEINMTCFIGMGTDNL